MKLLAIASLALVSQPGDPGGPVAFVSGNEIYSECSIPRADRRFTEGRSLCISYILATIDTSHAVLRSLNRRPLFCIPASLPGGQVANRVINWMERNPDARNQGASPLITQALIAIFPCPRR